MASAAIKTAALVHVLLYLGQTIMSGHVNPHQYDPSGLVLLQIQPKTVSERFVFPMADNARESSQVSATVTQGRSDTQRTPFFSITNVSQNVSIRSLARIPETAPDKMG